MGVSETPESCAAIQKVNNRLKKWADWNLMQFNTGEYKVLQLGEDDPRHQYTQEIIWKAAFQKRVLEFLVVSRSVSLKYVLVVRRH